MEKGGRFLEHNEPPKGKTWVKVVAVILAVVLVIGGLGAWFVVSKMNKIQKAQQGENKLTQDDISKIDRKSTRLNSSHVKRSRMPSSA